MLEYYLLKKFEKVELIKLTYKSKIFRSIVIRFKLIKYVLFLKSKIYAKLQLKIFK